MLIYNNCMFYNSKGTVYYKAAARHQKRANDMLAVISEALNSTPALSPGELARRFDAEKLFSESYISPHPPVTPPKATRAAPPATTVKRTPEKASPPLTRSKKRYFDCYDLRNKTHLKLKSPLDKLKRTRQTTLTSPSNRLKLFKKPGVTALQRPAKSPLKISTRKQSQASILTYVSRTKPKR